LEKDYDDPRLDKVRKGLRNLPIYLPGYWRREEELTEAEADAIARDHREHVLDFYRRFVKSINDMMTAGKVAGYKLISVCGP